MENPYRSPEFPVVAESPPVPTPRHYGGIRRLPYLGIMIGLAVLQNIVMTAAAAVGSGAGILFVGLLFMIVSFVPVYYRLMNVGMNPWWCLLMIVPIANLFVGIRCLICPEGYADTGKLDTAGKIVTGIILGLFGLLILLLGFAVFSG